MRIVTLFLFTLLSMAVMNAQQIEDQLALKKLVDIFSNLADIKRPYLTEVRAVSLPAVLVHRQGYNDRPLLMFREKLPRKLIISRN